MKRFVRLKPLCLFLCLMIAAVAQAGRDMQLVDRIVAVVNNQVITQKELHDRVEFLKNQASSEDRDLPSDNKLEKQVLDSMITEKLQLQLAERNHIDVSQDSLNEQVQNIAQSNNLSLTQFKNELQRRGIDYKQFRDRLHKQMIIQKMQHQALAPKIDITKEQIRSFMDNYKQKPHADSKYHVADIVVPLPDEPSQAQVNKARKKARQIKHKLAEGADFHKLAVAESQGSNALQGGDMGWNRLGELPDVFAKHLVTMQQGDIAGPIKAPNGFHVIQLKEAQQSDNKLTEDKARKMLFQRQFRHKLDNWLDKIKKQAYIKTMLHDEQ